MRYGRNRRHWAAGSARPQGPKGDVGDTAPMGDPGATSPQESPAPFGELTRVHSDEPTIPSGETNAATASRPRVDRDGRRVGHHARGGPTVPVSDRTDSGAGRTVQVDNSQAGAAATVRAVV
jgi:hypothetical protein